MSNSLVTFEIDTRTLADCDRCEPNYAKGLLSDCFDVKGSVPNEDPKWVVMCADCLAHAADAGCTVLRDGKPWDKSGVAFITYAR